MKTKKDVIVKDTDSLYISMFPELAKLTDMQKNRIISDLIVSLRNEKIFIKHFDEYDTIRWSSLNCVSEYIN